MTKHGGVCAYCAMDGKTACNCRAVVESVTTPATTDDGEPRQELITAAAEAIGAVTGHRPHMLGKAEMEVATAAVDAALEVLNKKETP